MVNMDTGNWEKVDNLLKIVVLQPRIRSEVWKEINLFPEKPPASL